MVFEHEWRVFLNTDLHELDGWVLRRGRKIPWESGEIRVREEINDVVLLETNLT